MNRTGFAPQFSRRRRAGFAPLPASAARSTDPPPASAPRRLCHARPSNTASSRKTGLKVTSVGFGCMITSDGSVIERAADMASPTSTPPACIRTATNERMVGAAAQKQAQEHRVIQQNRPPTTAPDAPR